MSNKIQVILQPEYTVDSAMVTEWYKNNGDRVNRGEAICFVDLGKSEGDFLSPADGLLEIIIPAGELIEFAGKKNFLIANIIQGS